MDGEGYLRLDPDVAGSREGNRLPLSDLYGLPVFADDTQQKAGELHTKEKQMLEGIRQEVFEKGGVWQTGERRGAAYRYPKPHFRDCAGIAYTGREKAGRADTGGQAVRGDAGSSRYGHNLGDLGVLLPEDAHSHEEVCRRDQRLLNGTRQMMSRGKE